MAGMVLMFAHGETVDILTAGTETDPYSGDSVPDWDTLTEVQAVAGVEPRPSGEPLQDARNSVVSGFTLYLEPATPITSGNRVRVRGDVYSVLGEPADWRNPFTGWNPGLVVQVERTEG